MTRPPVHRLLHLSFLAAALFFAGCSTPSRTTVNNNNPIYSRPTPTPSVPVYTTQTNPGSSTDIPIVRGGSRIVNNKSYAGIHVTLDYYSNKSEGPVIRDTPPKKTMAYIAGLRAGDLLISVNNYSMLDRCSLSNALKDKAPKESVPIRIKRGTSYLSGAIILEELVSTSGC